MIGVMCFAVVGEDEFLDKQIVMPEMEDGCFVAKTEKTLFLCRQGDDVVIFIT